MSVWPLMRREERSASNMPASIHRFFIVPSRQCLTRPVLDAGDGDHCLDTVRVRQRPAQPATDTEPGDGEHLLQSFAQRRGGVGVTLLELSGIQLAGDSE
jgi:hypothetical protein